MRTILGVSAMAADLLDDRCEALVLGIGNILWADEGFGPRCVERFHRLYGIIRRARRGRRHAAAFI